MSTILIVDDEPDICELFEFEFQTAGFETRTAQNVTAAKAVLEKENIDVILSDVRMPGGSGIDLLEWVRQHRTQSLVFLLMTGYSDVSLDRAFMHGAHGLFYKPLNLSEVTAFVAKSLSQQTDHGPAQRKSLRKSIACEATLTLNTTDAGGGHSIKGRVADISRGGIFVAIESAELPKLGQPLLFRFYSGIANQGEIAGEGVVRWIHPGSPSENHPQGAGIEFTKLDSNSIENLFSLITKLEIVPLQNQKHGDT